MNIALVVGCIGCLTLIACKSDGDEAGKATSDGQAALALAQNLTFEGGQRRDGDIPDATASLVSLQPPSDAVLIAPGDQHALLQFDFDNPDEADNPVGETLLQFDGVDEHVAIDRADSGGSGATIENTFSVQGDVCEGLCNRKYELTLFAAVALKDGKVSPRAKHKLTLDCSEDGDAKKCGDDGSSGGSSGRGGSPVTPADAGGSSGTAFDVANGFVQALDDTDSWEQCACADTATAGCDVVPAPAEDDAAISCIEPLLRDDAKAEAWLACATEWLIEAKACITAAGCDLAAQALCIPSEHVDGGKDQGAPPEVIERCGAVDVAFTDGLDGCIGGGQAADGGMSNVPPPPVDCSTVEVACMEAVRTYCECCVDSAWCATSTDLCTLADGLKKDCLADPSCAGDCNVWIVGDCASFQAAGMCNEQAQP